MLGAIIGDIIGSRFEFNNYLKKDFELFTNKNYFTDDSVLTLAIAKAFLDHSKDDPALKKAIIKNMQEIGRNYPDSGYGLKFFRWLFSSNPQPYNSIGNGSAMRVSSVAYVADTLEECKELAKLTAEVTHNHPEGIKGAQATATAIFMAKNGSSKEEIIKEIQKNYYDYDFLNDFTIEKIKPTYGFYETCQDSVPQALEVFFESKDYEDTIRNAVALGGDSDTIAAIAGSVAEAYYGIPEEIAQTGYQYLDQPLAEIYDRFKEKYQ